MKFKSDKQRKAVMAKLYGSNKPCPGSKIRSKGNGRGLGYGKGSGPLQRYRGQEADFKRVFSKPKKNKYLTITNTGKPKRMPKTIELLPGGPRFPVDSVEWKRVHELELRELKASKGVKNIPKIKGWTKIGSEMWEHKKRDSSIILSVSRHPINKKYWTVESGQAPISMPKIKTKIRALKLAVDWMEEHPKG